MSIPYRRSCSLCIYLCLFIAILIYDLFCFALFCLHRTLFTPYFVYAKLCIHLTLFTPWGGSRHCPAGSCPHRRVHNYCTNIQSPAYRTAGGASCRARQTRRSPRAGVPDIYVLFFWSGHNPPAWRCKHWSVWGLLRSAAQWRT